MKKYKFTINGNPYEVAIKREKQGSALVEVNGSEYQVDIVEEPVVRKTPQIVRQRVVHETGKKPVKTKAAASITPSVGAIKAPLPGVILEILVKEGDEVTAGQPIMQMEAMKMENNIQSNRNGRVKSIKVKQGDSVLEGAVLAEIGG